MQLHKSPRTHGLDTLRAIAIMLVFAFHYRVFVSHEPTFGWPSIVGWVGVDLFFVLSGYLIANQIFAGVVRGEQLSLRHFYLRRALRTWPAFWVILAAFFIFPSFMGGNPPPPLWKFLTFTQNFGLQIRTAFSHAWSLCIEEQFYLVLPLIVIFATKLTSRKNKIWLLISSLITLGIATRAYYWPSYTHDVGGYHTFIYYSTWCRIDEFLPGVAVAALKHFHPHAWQTMMRHGKTVFIGGLIANFVVLFGVYNFYLTDTGDYYYFMTVFGYSLVAISFSLLVIAALSPTTWLHNLRIPGVYSLALWSYSIYLTHKTVGFVIGGYAQQYAWPNGLTPAVTILVSLLMGALLYHFIEAPFMALRDRHFPSNFAAQNNPVNEKTVPS